MFGGDAVRQVEMRGELCIGLVNIVERRAGQFELPPRLERNCAAGFLVEQPDQRARVLNGGPSGGLPHALQDSLDAAAPVAPLVGHRGEVIGVVGKLLVLRAELQRRCALGACFQPADEFVARGDGCRVGDVARHGTFRESAIRTSAFICCAVK